MCAELCVALSESQPFFHCWMETRMLNSDWGLRRHYGGGFSIAGGFVGSGLDLVCFRCRFLEPICFPGDVFLAGTVGGFCGFGLEFGGCWPRRWDLTVEGVWGG